MKNLILFFLLYYCPNILAQTHEIEAIYSPIQIYNYKQNRAEPELPNFNNPTWNYKNKQTTHNQYFGLNYVHNNNNNISKELSIAITKNKYTSFYSRNTLGHYDNRDTEINETNRFSKEIDVSFGLGLYKRFLIKKGYYAIGINIPFQFMLTNHFHDTNIFNTTNTPAYHPYTNHNELDEYYANYYIFAINLCAKYYYPLSPKLFAGINLFSGFSYTVQNGFNNTIYVVNSSDNNVITNQNVVTNSVQKINNTSLDKNIFAMFSIKYVIK